MKRIWMNLVYSSICGSYLVKSRPERTNEMMEQVLFLMHHESLKKDGNPFLEYPVYIDGDKVRIPYIHELLCVHRPVLIGGYRGYYEYYKRLHNTYHKMLNRYRRYDEAELNQAVKKILETETLDPQYYVFEEYHSMHHLRAARFKINSETHFILNFIRMLIFLIPLPCFLIGAAYAYSIAEEYHIVIHVAQMKELFIICVMCTLVGAFWTYKWTNLTAFERSKMIGEQYDY